MQVSRFRAGSVKSKRRAVEINTTTTITTIRERDTPAKKWKKKMSREKKTEPLYILLQKNKRFKTNKKKNTLELMPSKYVSSNLM